MAEIRVDKNQNLPPYEGQLVFRMIALRCEVTVGIDRGRSSGPMSRQDTASGVSLGCSRSAVADVREVDRDLMQLPRRQIGPPICEGEALL